MVGWFEASSAVHLLTSTYVSVTPSRSLGRISGDCPFQTTCSALAARPQPLSSNIATIRRNIVFIDYLRDSDDIVVSPARLLEFTNICGMGMAGGAKRRRHNRENRQ